MADAWYEVGEIRRQRGDLTGAEAAYAEAHAIGRDPQPGLALLRKAQGKVDVAMASIAATLATFGGSRPERAPLLAAQVEIALIAGDVDLAEQAAAELVEIARPSTAPACGPPATAGPAPCRWPGARRWRPSRRSAPARSPGRRSMRPTTPPAAGSSKPRPAPARRPGRRRPRARRGPGLLRAAGGGDELRYLDQSLAGPTRPGRRGLTARELEVLRLVAAGQTNREIAADLVISEKTVARHVANIFTKLGVSSRSAATAFAFEHGLLTADVGGAAAQNYPRGPRKDACDARCAHGPDLVRSSVTPTTTGGTPCRST